MKNRILRDGSLGLALAVLLGVVGGSRELAGQSSNSIIAPLAKAATATNAEPAVATQTPPAPEEQPDAELADAPIEPISTEKPLPPNVKPSDAAAGVVRLANSGVDSSVVLAYISNSTNTFHLGAEEIIYLNDIGISGKIVTAMIQHDQAMKGGAMVTILPPAPASEAAVAPVPASAFASDPVPAPDASGQYAPVPDASGPPVEILPGDAPPAEYASEEDGPPPAVAEDSAFYDSLAPYGTWVNVGGYGNCWQPSAAAANPDWQPYLDCGRWVYSDCGWYWLSGYSWGWGPFHYGRWFRHNRVGWCWSPGRVWAPSWVAWRYSGNYCGWAPLPPCAWYRPGVGLTCRGRPVSSTFAFGLTPQSYAFVAFNHFYENRLPNVAVPNRQVTGIFALTTFSAGIGFSNHRVINNGLPPRAVATGTHTSIHRVAIHDSTQAGGGGRAERFGSGGTALTVFRPVAPQAAGSRAGTTPRPAVQGRGNSHSFNSAPKTGSPIVLHGATHSLESASLPAATGASPAPVAHPATHGTTWKDIPRASAANVPGTDAASYQRWQQRIQPAQSPWYLPSASPAASRTIEKTSRAESRQLADRPVNAPAASSSGSRPDALAGTAGFNSHQSQYSSSRSYQVPRSDYSVPPSAFAARPGHFDPSPSPVQRSEVAPARAATMPVQTYVAPAQNYSPAPGHAAASQPSQSSAATGQSRSSSGSGRNSR